MIQGAINFLWFCFDIVIFYTFFKWGRKEFGSIIGDKYFWPWTIFEFVMAGSLVIGLYYAFLPIPIPGLEGLEQLNIPNYGCWYMAFIQNLLMSALFIRMLFDRGSTRGQSMALAIFKCIGTLAPTLMYAFWIPNLLNTLIGTFCFVLDVTYIYLLTRPEFKQTETARLKKGTASS